MEIFNISKRFPPEEKYSLTDQIRRYSRSVCTNLAEAYRRRRYKDYFTSKLNDCETENAETQVWLDFSHDCKYITTEEYSSLTTQNATMEHVILTKKWLGQSKLLANRLMEKLPQNSFPQRWLE